MDMADAAPEGESDGVVVDDHLNVVVDIIPPEEYVDDTELNQDNLVQELNYSGEQRKSSGGQRKSSEGQRKSSGGERKSSGGPKNSSGEAVINEDKEDSPNVTKMGLNQLPMILQNANGQFAMKGCYDPCAYAETDSMISLPFLAGGEKYLPDAFKAIATAGRNLFNSFQQYVFEEECDAFMDSNDFNNSTGRCQDETGTLNVPQNKTRLSQQEDVEGNEKKMSLGAEKPPSSEDQRAGGESKENEQAAAKPPCSEDQRAGRMSNDNGQAGNPPNLEDQEENRKSKSQEIPETAKEENNEMSKGQQNNDKNNQTDMIELKPCIPLENDGKGAEEDKVFVPSVPVKSTESQTEEEKKSDKKVSLKLEDKVDEKEKCKTAEMIDKSSQYMPPTTEGKVDRSSQCQKDDGENEPISSPKEKRKKSRDSPIEEEQPRRKSSERRRSKSKEKSRDDEEAESRRRKMEEESQKEEEERAERRRKKLEEEERKEEEERAERRRRKLEEEERKEEEERAERRRRKLEEEEKQKEEEERERERRRRKSEEEKQQKDDEAERRRRKSEEEQQQRDEEERAERRRRKSEEEQQQKEEERRRRKSDEEQQKEEERRRRKSEEDQREKEEEMAERRRRKSEEEQQQKEEEERAERRRRKSEERRKKEEEAEQQRQDAEADREPKKSSDDKERRKSKAERKYKDEDEDEAMAERRRLSLERKEARAKRGKERKSKDNQEEGEEGPDNRVQLYNANLEREDKKIIVITEVGEVEEDTKRKQVKEKQLALLTEMEDRRRVSNDNADRRNVELDIEMRRQMREARKSLDFVDYFFKKDGFTYIGILTQMKLDFEQRAMQVLSKSSEAIQKNAKRFKNKIDALKKIIPVEKEKEIEEYNYPVVLEKDCRKFEIEIEDKIVHITKFHKYALKLVLHWKYLIREQKDLELLTVYEAATELLAGTMVLVYPIFVRLAAFVATMCDNPRQSMDTYSSKYLIDQLRKMVDTISDEIGAIEESSTIVMKQLPSKNPKELSDMLQKLKSQGVHAKNSLSWAIKTLGTVLFHYNLLSILVQNGQFSSSMAKSDKTAPVENTTATQKTFTVEAPKKKGDLKDFVDVFFQREGFQFIGVLTKLKMTYEDRCKLELQRASPKVRDMAELVADKIHQIRKLTPPKEEKILGEYDFPSAFVKEISEFEIDVADKLNTIKQFHKYTTKLIDHWSVDLDAKVKVDPQSTYEVAIQLMAGLMALIYPILIKMANYMSKLAETPRASKTHHPPERIARKIRKMIEAVTDELGAVGTACMKTTDRICGPTETGKDIKLKILTQMKHAKNSVSWGVKAISPSLFYYFLRVLSDQEKSGSENKK